MADNTFIVGGVALLEEEEKKKKKKDLMCQCSLKIFPHIHAKICQIDILLMAGNPAPVDG